MALAHCSQTSAGFTNEKGHKSGLQAMELGPAAIILDAELTLPTPERLWYLALVQFADVSLLTVGSRPVCGHWIMLLVSRLHLLHPSTSYIKFREPLPCRVPRTPSISLLWSYQGSVHVPTSIKGTPTEHRDSPEITDSGLEEHVAFSTREAVYVRLVTCVGTSFRCNLRNSSWDNFGPFFLHQMKCPNR